MNKFYLTILLFSFTNNILSNHDLNDVDISLLRQALEIPAGGGNNKSYYNISINGEKVGGERSWEARWNLIKDKLNLAGKNILDIGCNIGLFSVYSMKFKNANSAVGIENSTENHTKNGFPRLMEAAQLLQKAFKTQMKILQIDLNQTKYEKIIGHDYDFVFCLSIFKWINDKQRFLKYLSNFKEILYEGHDDDKTEIERFKNIGFKNYSILGSTHVGNSYAKEQTRTLIHFSK